MSRLILIEFLMAMESQKRASRASEILHVRHVGARLEFLVRKKSNPYSESEWVAMENLDEELIQ